LKENEEDEDFLNIERNALMLNYQINDLLEYNNILMNTRSQRKEKFSLKKNL
jgi:hypothetical protein